jgi:hypothetical protein
MVAGFSFLAWYLPRKEREIADDTAQKLFGQMHLFQAESLGEALKQMQLHTEAETNRWLEQFCVLCPVASGILNRVTTLEKSTGAVKDEVRGVERRVGSVEAEITKYDEKRAEEDELVPVGTMGFNPQTFGRP